MAQTEIRNTLKQEQKNKTLAISLVVLLTITVGLFWLQGKRDEIDIDLFRVPQLSDVDGISLRSRENQVLLSYEGSRWRVNNLYDADNQMITVLFATLQQVEPKRKVSALLAGSVASVLQNLGVRISLFQGESMVGEFYVGGNKSKTEAYFMSEDNEPYVVTIPGYRVYAAGVFELGENGWRDKRIFNFNWRNFKRLEAQFRQQPDQSFSIEDLGSGFG
ncbi:MAG: DUF4340 domain-containing protein, partial [Cyclobacteriaceae bacterium]